MNVKAIGVIFALLFAVTAAESDQEYWIEQGEQNAIRDLDQWPDAVTALNDNNPTPVNEQLAFWKSQVDDGVTNMDEFIPTLISIVDRINSLAAGEPNDIRRGELQTILRQIDGQRDNKSYYLLDGAVQWIANRLDSLQAGGERANDLVSQLTEAQTSVAKLRDELDSNAQNYVRAITKIQKLKEDIAANIVEIRAIASALLDALQSSVLLQNAGATNEFVKSITA
ncbi:uncharacterized protein LOC119081913 [Bradysia coprophila]|uniref:uncharacterized protein LOC119081913 n=1 Tax=Bradysia coprophila TaxID=38358 RepID=UPI00187DBF62|nr:uncharacterized protein LOC119081913 [Bradysia coprophila]